MRLPGAMVISEPGVLPESISGSMIQTQSGSIMSVAFGATNGQKAILMPGVWDTTWYHVRIQDLAATEIGMPI